MTKRTRELRNSLRKNFVPDTIPEDPDTDGEFDEDEEDGDSGGGGD